MCLSYKFLHAFCHAASQVSEALCTNSLKSLESSFCFLCKAPVSHTASSSQALLLSCSPPSLTRFSLHPQLSAGQCTLAAWTAALLKEEQQRFYHGVLEPVFSGSCWWCCLQCQHWLLQFSFGIQVTDRLSQQAVKRKTMFQGGTEVQTLCHLILHPATWSALLLSCQFTLLIPDAAFPFYCFSFVFRDKISRRD